jgi:response regulator RpfG family c-di-GMP phosphodiesterase
MNNRVLFVDDEINVLDGIRRNLRKSFDVVTAAGPEEGLQAIAGSAAPFAVIVSDMRMPGMDGIEFLERARALAPDTVRIMLTGNADQETAVRAVNRGEVFKFLNKPCDHLVLEQVVTLGLRQYQLVMAERELLDNTLKGSIEAMVEILALAKPLAFGRVKRIRDLCLRIIQHMNVNASWEVEAAIMLSQLGCITMPEAILEKLSMGGRLSGKELEAYQQHPQLAFSLINRIPRLDKVAEIVWYQQKNFDGTGVPGNSIQQQAIPFGARVLRAALEFDDRKTAGFTNSQALEHLRRQASWFDPAVLAALVAQVETEKMPETISLPLELLEVGMILDEDIKNDKNVLLACRGLELSRMLLDHLLNFKSTGSLTRLQKVKVRPKPL